MAAAKSKPVKINTAGRVEPATVSVQWSLGEVHWCAALHSISAAQAKKAAAALLKWYGEETSKAGGNQLFEDDQEMFSIQITLRKIPDKKRHKPILM